MTPHFEITLQGEKKFWKKFEKLGTMYYSYTL
jgi:hypothetical protein